jgi:homocysteine S-methyltransferase
VILDGGLSTELERRGHDISSQLWSARLLHDDPDAIADAHAAFLRAGAQVLTTASYQASAEGFVRAGFDARDSRRLVRRSVGLARRAVEETGLPARVAGSAGPYGAMLADGSEYTGRYPAGADVREFHRRKLGDLAEAGPDLLAVETVPSAAEALLLLAELERLDHPAWLSLTTVTGPDGVVRTRTGEPAAEVFTAAAEVGCVVAVGVNCTDPRTAEAAVRVAAASGRPVVVYPNSGEEWDDATRSWRGTPVPLPRPAMAWRDAGADLIGGCCRVGPDQIAAIAAALA